MFGKLTKIKIIVLVCLCIALIMKSSDIKKYLTPYDDITPDANSKILIKDSNPTNNKSLNIAATSKISIFITNLGLQKANLKLAQMCPRTIGFGISSYTENIPDLISNIISNGRVSAILLSTQSINSSISDPGPKALLANSGILDNKKQFQNFISAIPSNEVGIYLAADSLSSLDIEFASNLIRLLEESINTFKFFAYYDDQGGGNIISSLLKSSEIANKSIIIHSVIDRSLTEESIMSSLDNLAELSLKNQSVSVGSISATKISIESLEKWLKLNQDKVELIDFKDLLP